MRIRIGHSSAPACPRRKGAGAECRPDPAASRVSGAPRRRARGPPCWRGPRARVPQRGRSANRQGGWRPASDRTSMAGTFQSSTAHSKRPHPRSTAKAASARSRAPAHPWRRCSGSTKRSSSHSPGRPRNVEKLWKNKAKAAGLPSFHASRTSAAGRGLNRACSRSSLAAMHKCESFSYSAKARIIAMIASTSRGSAGRISNPGGIGVGFISGSALRKSTCSREGRGRRQHRSDRGCGKFEDHDVAVSTGPALRMVQCGNRGRAEAPGATSVR